MHSRALTRAGMIKASAFVVSISGRKRTSTSPGTCAGLLETPLETMGFEIPAG